MNSLIALIQLELEYILAEGNLAVIPYIIALIIGLLLPTVHEVRP
jgi:hypothetical protein